MEENEAVEMRCWTWLYGGWMEVEALLDVMDGWVGG